MAGEDLFGDREIPNLRVKPPREWPAPEPPGLLGLAVVGLLGVGAAALFDMPLGWPLPLGALFAAGCVATRAACNHRRVQQTLRPLTAAFFFAFGLPTIVTAYPPTVRFVFYAVLLCSGVWLYEWSAKH